MILMLRMLTSHILTIQDTVQYVLDEEAIKKLKDIQDENPPADSLSPQISRLILFAKEGRLRMTAPMQNEGYHASRHHRGDAHKLARAYWNFLEIIQHQGGAEEYNFRLKCAACENLPTRAIVTSCKHLYCEECFYTLEISHSEHEDDLPICCSCEMEIEEAAYYGAFDDIKQLRNCAASDSSGSSKGAKRKDKSKRKQSKEPKRKRARKRLAHLEIDRSSSINSNDVGDSSSSEDDQEDWLEIIGSQMPGTKLNKVRDLIRKWIEEDKEVKIVVFSEFLDSIKLLGWMCKNEGWGYTQV